MLKDIIRKAGSYLLADMDKAPKQKEESDFVTNADLRIHAYLHQILPKYLPGSYVISEEDQAAKHVNDGCVWIVDPVDGTSNIVYDLRHSCVSIGLLRHGQVAEGAIFNPYLDELFYAKRGEGSTLNGRPIRVSSEASLENGFIGFEAGPASKHHPDRIMGIMKHCYQHTNGIRMLGSSALDLAYVACGRFTAAYFDYLYPWDYAAGMLILEEAGGKFTDLSGAAPCFSSRNIYIASNGHVHQSFADMLRSL